MAGDKTGADATDVITIKKYANRRLYNTATSSYVTLDALSTMVKNGEDFVVFDAKSGENITRSVLTQIIFEEEAKGENSMQAFVPSYLEMSLEALQKNQAQYTRTFGGEAAMEAMDQLTRRNMAMYESAMSAFSPTPSGDATPPAEDQTTTKADTSEIESLREQMAQMQQSLEAITKQKK